MWIERELIVCNIEELKFSDNGKLENIDIAKLCLLVPKLEYPIDFGALCFSERKKTKINSKTNKHLSFLVNKKSFKKARLVFFSSYLEYLYNYYKLGWSSFTIKNHISLYQRFIFWCDKNFVITFDGELNYINSVKIYTEYLLELVRTNKINVNSASAFQKVVLNVGSFVYEDKYGDLVRSVRKIKISSAAVNITEKPDDLIARKTLSIYSDLFFQLSHFVLDFQKFPKLIELEHANFWFFPNSIPFAGPTTLHTKPGLQNRFLAYNYEHGSVRSSDQIYDLLKPGQKYCLARSIRKKALSLIGNANKDYLHNRRLNAASLAFQSFIMLFSAHSGMSLSQISSLEWGADDFEVGKIRQNYKSIKYRANGRNVSFLIGTELQKEFKKFLKLRNYILNAVAVKKFDKLFFTIVSKKPRVLPQDFSFNYHKRLSNCFDFHEKINTRMWRAFKSDWLLRNSSITTTALILQNTPNTVLKHYSSGSQSQSEEELTSFFRNYKMQLVTSTKDIVVSTSVGQCQDIDSPYPIPDNKVTPNCKIPEGCLFCDKYRVHADTNDYRKLLSCKYVIEFTKKNSSDDSKYKDTFDAVIKKINNIIKQILSVDKANQKKYKLIMKEVYKLELLDGYWKHKLRMLETAGEI